MPAESQVEERIAATPLSLYRLVSDVTRMGEWSPETDSCRWLAGADGPAIGASFKGSNRRGWRRWSTTCTVVAADPGRSFAFDVHLARLPISRWTYDFDPDGDGCRVTESWTDRRPGWIVRLAPVVTGVRDQESHNRAGMRTTLARLRAAAERGTSGPTDG